MTANAALQVLAYFVVVSALALPLGIFMAQSQAGEGGVARLFRPLERVVYRVGGVNVDDEMDWRRYAKAVVVFSLLCVVTVYACQRLQAHLPLNPLAQSDVEPGIAFNTAVSFATNTNWQAYGGETTMSFFTQTVALTTQNFVSAAAGIAVLYALARGFARKETDKLGNFWVDITRLTLHVLLPLSFVFALALAALGVPQTFTAVAHAQTVDGAAQDMALGPVASQIAIKQLGTNGGGFFNANSAHPFENPTPLTNFLEDTAILLIAAACVVAFGRMIHDRRQALALYATMLVLSVPFVFACIAAESHAPPAVAALVDDALADGGNMEGKEVRFGVVDSALWAVTTTDASNGSVNAMHDSFTPLGGLLPLVNIELGEVVFGGVGSGLYGLLVYAIIAVFIAGLMVGRTPEYLGKKLGAYEMKCAATAILVPAFLILAGTGVAVMVPSASSSDVLPNPGAHGFSEILYAFSSAAGNNGSAFAGLAAGGAFYTVAQAVAMWCGRFFVIIPVLAIAGSLAQKKTIPASSATLPTHTPLFVVLLAGTVVLVGLLTFVPALALGPVAEHLAMIGGAR